MEGSPARFEFRVWGDGLQPVARRLAAGPADEVVASEETYLALRTTTNVNPKIRSGLLDVKVLRAVVDRFEQWDPEMKSPLPITAADLHHRLFPLLGLDPPALEREEYDAAALLSEVVDPHPDLDALPVSKHRTRYRFDGCSAEVSTVSLAGRILHTVAIESDDLAALGAARHRLGLDGMENRSYPAMIQELRT